MRLNFLLAFIPAAIALYAVGAHPLLIFGCSALALIPLSRLSQDSTESLASDLGPTWGGLLSASLGNAPEIIIGASALRRGLVDVVKSSLVGSILGNLLLALGLSMLLGGLRNGTQRFNRRVAGTGSALLTLTAASLIIPAVFNHTTGPFSRAISVEVAGVLFVIYLASLVFIVTTSRPAAGKQAVEAQVVELSEEPRHESGWSRGRALGILAASTFALAVVSEILTDAIEPASVALGLTSAFSGVFLLALAGNVSETSSAVGFARMGKMDLSLGVTVGSSIQVALLVAPVLVFYGAFLGKPMDLVFGRFEVVAVFLAVLVTRPLIDDGESTWLDGLMLVGVYAMLGIGFFYLTKTPQPGF